MTRWRSCAPADRAPRSDRRRCRCCMTRSRMAGTRAGDGTACRKASIAVDAVARLILSDRGVDAHHARFQLLAVAGVLITWVREGTRHKCGLLIESRRGARGPSTRALLGYALARSNPYLRLNRSTIYPPGPAARHYPPRRRQALHQGAQQGVLKVMSKMRHSTLQSYCGAQIFEAIGLDRAFVGSTSRPPRRRSAALAWCRCRKRFDSGTRAPLVAKATNELPAAASTVAARRRAALFNPERCSSCSTRRAPAIRRLQEYTQW